jgi:hypothetical protein
MQKPEYRGLYLSVLSIENFAYKSLSFVQTGASEKASSHLPVIFLQLFQLLFAGQGNMDGWMHQVRPTG